MARSSKKAVENTENKLLALVEGGATPRCPAYLSMRGLAQSLGITEGQARSAQRSLTRSGMLRIECRFAPDGGQLSNGYRLSAAGRIRLKAASNLLENSAK